MSNYLDHKIDFVVVFSVQNANPNGDPLLGNRPRTNAQGNGILTDVCLKRKLRNRLSDMGHEIFVQSDDRKVDEFDSLQNRAEAALAGLEGDPVKFTETACEKWIDVRSFGQLFAYSTKKKKAKGKKGEETSSESVEGVSIGVRGPVTVQDAVTISPVEIEEIKITKSVNGNSTENGKKASDTFGDKYQIPFGVYVFRGSINSRLAEKTGFSLNDANAVHAALKTLFENDESSARPSGSMEVLKVYWFEHNQRDGQYPSGVVHRSVSVRPATDYISSLDEVIFEVKPLEGLFCDEYSTI